MNKEETEKRIKLTYEQIRKYTKNNLSSSYLDTIIKNSTKKMFDRVTKDELKLWLNSPEKYEDKLRGLIEFMYNSSGEFQRVVNYIPNASLITPILISNNNKYTNKKKEQKKNDFIKCLDYMESLKIKSNSRNAINVAFKDGVYYAIELEGEFSYYTKQLSPDNCKIIGQGESGLIIAFDFSYFNGMEYILDNGYPPIFRELYNKYKNGVRTLQGLKLSANWQPLPEDITFVVKFDTTKLNYSIPPFINIYPQLQDLEEYKSINKARTTSEAYNLLCVKVPLLNNGESDDFAVSDEVVDTAINLIDQSIPDWMGWCLLPGLDGELLKASSSGQSSSNSVEEATKSVFGSIGIASQLFGVNNVNSGTLKYSIDCDMQMLYGLYRQIETHYNYKIQKQFKGKIRLKILDINYFNIENFINYCKEQSSLGVPVLTLLPCILGISQLDSMDLSEQQVDIFEILDKWIPASTSYTQSGNSDGGRPEKEDSDLTESGEQTRRDDLNANR